MVNHGLVVAPLFIIALLAARAHGSDDLRQMGGLAARAPVLAALFLIVALATLAMPGSANFVAEFLILLGVFKAKIAFAIIATAGVVLAAVYTIRLYQRSDAQSCRARGRAREMMGRRRGLGSDRRRHHRAGRLSAADPEADGGQRQPQRRRHADRPDRARLAWRTAVIPLAELKAPHVDYAGLSPLLALSGGACVTLMAGLLRAHVARVASAVCALLTLAVAAGSRSGSWERTS